MISEKQLNKVLVNRILKTVIRMYRKLNMPKMYRIHLTRICVTLLDPRACMLDPK